MIFSPQRLRACMLGLALLIPPAAVLAQAPKPAPAATNAPAATPRTVRTSQEAFNEARELYSDGDWARALAAFQRFETDPATKFSLAIPDAIYYQGWCWANQGRWQEAANVFQRLISTYTNNVLVPEALLKQAECYRELKEMPKSLDLYRRFQAQFSNHELLPQAMLGEAWVLFKSGNTAAAKNQIRSVQQRFAQNQSVNLDCLFLLGQVLTEEKDFKAANAVYKQITAQRSNPRATTALYLAAEAMFSRGEALQHDNQHEEAKQAFRDAINYYKGVRPKVALIELVQRDIDAWNAERGRWVAQLGVEGWQSRSESLKRLLLQIKEQPDLRVRALFRVANCFQSLDMPEEASVVYQFLLDRFPDDRAAEQIWFGLIQTLTQRGQLEKANKLSEEFKTKFANSQMMKNATFIQAESQFGQKLYKEALDNYSKALEAAKDPQLIEMIEFRIATCQFNLENFTEAATKFAALAQKHAESKIRPDALFFLGLTHYEIANRSNDPKVAQPNIADAIKAYEEIRAKHTDSERVPLATFRLGYLYSFAGSFDRDEAGKTTSVANFDSAIAVFQEFITKWPSQAELPEAMYQIARNHISASRPDQAIPAFQAVVEKFPDHDLAPYSAVEIATTYLAQKKPTEMVRALRSYVSKYPEHARVGDALFLIASELETQGKLDEAIMAYRDIINRALSAATLSDQDRDAAVGAQLRVCDLLERQKIEPKTIVADCEQVLAKFITHPIAARALVGQIASIYQRNRLTAEAYTKLEQLSQQYAANTAVRHAAVISMVELALRERDLSRANALASRLLADPEAAKLPPAGFIAIGNALLRSDRFAPARDNFQKVLTSTTEPKLVTFARLGLGQSLLGMRDLDSAKEALEEALKDEQHCPRNEAELALAKVLEGKSDLEGAVKLYTRVLPTKGDIGFEAAYRLGNIFYKKGSKDDMKLALGYYARLLFASGPMAEEAAFRTGECHEALGNRPMACSVFQSYMKRFPSGKFIEDAKANATRLCSTSTKH